MKIRSSRFFNNSASDKGGAIHAETRSHLLDVQDTEFDTNTVGQPTPCAASCHIVSKNAYLPASHTGFGSMCYSLECFALRYS